MIKDHFRKILVTGASGFVGRALVRCMLEEGYPVRAVYRREQVPPHLVRAEALGAEVERRDLNRPEDIEAAVRNVDAVIHMAGLVDDWAKYENLKAINYDATVSLLQAARRQGCRVFLYLSSAAVQGFGPHVHSREDQPWYPLSVPYQVTKKMAEEYVLSQNAESFRTAAIRAGDVIGPDDYNVFYHIFQGMEKRIMGYLGDGYKLTSPLYVDNLAQALILALEKEQSAGQAFIITGGEEVTWRQLLEYTALQLGVKPPFIVVPVFLSNFLALSLGGLFRLLGIKAAPPITRYRVGHMIYDYHFSIEKARKILGYRPTVGWQEGMRRTVEAYRQEKSRTKHRPT